MLRKLFLFLLLLSSVCGQCATGGFDYPTHFLKSLDKRSNDELLEQAVVYLRSDNKTDSATACYHIMANRLWEKSQTHDDELLSIYALNDLGYMYYFYYYDYRQSYSYLNQALQMAEERGQSAALPYIWLNLGNLYSTLGKFLSITDQSSDNIACYQKAFRAAVKERDYSPMLVAFYGLANVAYQYKKTMLIKEDVAQMQSLKSVPDSLSDLKNMDLLFCKAIRCYERGDRQGAISLFRDMNTHSKMRYTPERYVVMNNLRIAGLLADMHRYGEATSVLNETMRYTSLPYCHDLEIYVYDNMSRIYMMSGDSIRGQHYEYLYLRNKEAFLNNANVVRTQKLHFTQQLDSANTEIRQLYHDRQVNRIIVVAVFCGALFLGLLFMILLRNYRRLQRDHEMLYRKSVELIEQEDRHRQNIERQKAEAARQKNEETVQKNVASTVHKDAVSAVQNDAPQAKPSSVDEAQLAEVREKIDSVFNGSDEIFHQDFTLNRLADIIDMKYWTLSPLIKQIYDKNFNALINEYRIREACRRLKDFDKYGQLTIEAIAIGLGFKSRPNFVTNFKRIVGLSPSEYQKLARRNETLS